MKSCASLQITLLTSFFVLPNIGCSGTQSTPVAPCSIPVAPCPSKSSEATGIYVVQNVTPGSSSQPAILQLPANSSGTISPISTINLPANLILGSLTTDSSGNIYVATSSDIREYAAGSTGNATPLRILPANATTTIGVVNGLAVDSSGNLFVSEERAGIAVFTAAQNGSVAPSRYILGASQPGGGLSTLELPGAIAVDASGNLYIANQNSNFTAGSIVVFGPTATGNVAPARVITGALTMMNGAPTGLATDLADNLYAASNNLTTAGPSVLVFAAEADGNIAPTRTISGSSTRLGMLWNVTVDPAANIYVVTDGTPFTNSLTAIPTILNFSAGASGNIAPASSFTWQWGTNDTAGNYAIASN